MLNERRNGVGEGDEKSISSLSDEDSTTSTVLNSDRPTPTSIVHIRSFSEGFYSFDKSSLSSDCSENSNERLNFFHHSKSHVSSESGVSEDIGSTEALTKLEINDNDSIHFDNKLLVDTLTSTQLTDSNDSSLSAQTTPKKCNHLSALSPDKGRLPLTNGQMFYQPPTNHKTKTLHRIIVGSATKPQRSLQADVDFDSDGSDSSVEIIRIITRL